MELKDFLSESLSQIVAGIKQAQNNPDTAGSKIVPRSYYAKTGESDLEERDTANPVFYIEYDLAITITQGTHTKGGIGVWSGVVGAGSQGKSDKTNESVSRIKFEIPIIYPECGRK